MNNKNNIFNDEKFLNIINTDENFAYMVNWIENNSSTFLKNSQEMLCSEMFVSQASISRFVKKCGFNTFRELQVYVAKRSQEVIPKIDLSLKESNTIVDIKENVFQQYSNLSKIVYNSVDDSILETLTNDILKSDIIFIMGIGTNGEIARYYSRQFRKFGIKSYDISSIHDFIDDVEGFSNSKIHVILLSKSFKTKELITAANIMEKKNIDFSLITTNEDINNLNYKNLLTYKYFDNKSFSFDIANKIALYMVLDIILLYTATKVDPEMTTFEHSKELLKKFRL
ncbi:MurR/RpiR family transcriptional regulator [Mycoplasma crocodyli]|uniref:Putative HTH-type transcriptional regulator n=1 Tax=Mycoplasma crocodyli (strain ATCC 51981 / MP145) TaxID=512564 RepID=D5E5J2_MYCCM|nr:MurR/RpiR family transcriptional regulator [Mycoplasma crocodyli]ADE19551.1 putative HTH-type transcriptional regulator [Mycoplasma crocodyli MP145]